MVPHRALQRDELIARSEAQSLVADRASPVARGERLRLALRVVERSDELVPPPVAQRLLGQKALELGHEHGMTTQLQVCLDPVLERDETQLVQAARLVRDDPAVAHVREGGSAPELERGAEAVSYTHLTLPTILRV